MGPEALHPVTAVASGQPKGLSGRCQILPDVTWEVASPRSGPVASKAHTLPRGAVCSANQDPQDGREVKVWSSQEVHMGLKCHHSERVRYSWSCEHITRGHTVMCSANQDPQDGSEAKVWSSQEVHMGVKRHLSERVRYSFKRHHSERVRYSGSCGHVTRGHTIMVTLSHLFFIWDYFLFFYFYLVVIISLNYE